jgi:membrane-associated phospholipid phosphatase
LISPASRTLARRWLPHAAAAIVLGCLLAWDQPVFRLINGCRSPFLDSFTARIGQLHGAALPAMVGLLLVAGGFIFKRRRVRRAGTALVLTMLLAGTITSALKVIVARPGPGGDIALEGESWFDARFGRFPSSHSAITFGAASALGAFVPAAAVPGFAFAALVSYERIYRNTHFPSDVFAGIWIGLVAARFVLSQLARRGWAEDFAKTRSRQSTTDTVSNRWTEDRRVEHDREPVA